jgi:hypothetical protein
MNKLKNFLVYTLHSISKKKMEEGRAGEGGKGRGRGRAKEKR